MQYRSQAKAEQGRIDQILLDTGHRLEFLEDSFEYLISDHISDLLNQSWV